VKCNYYVGFRAVSEAQLFKAKIEVPLNQGRTMYGVLDELNVLQYGQVFVQYSENKNKPGENTKVLTGMYTRFL